MVWEPADGIAAARCLAARTRDPERRETVDHGSACDWCDYPTGELANLVEGFNRWAGWDGRSNSYAEHEVRRFYDLPREQQRSLIAAAQGLTGNPWSPVQPEPESAPPKGRAPW